MASTRESGKPPFQPIPERTRTKISRGIMSLVGGGLAFALLLWLYSTTQAVLFQLAAFLLGLGPALSGIKNLVSGLLELRASRKDHL